MTEDTIQDIIEALIFSNPEPVSPQTLKTVLEARMNGFDISVDEIDEQVQGLNEIYRTSGRSFGIQKLAGGYSFATKVEFHPWLEHIQHENAFRKITQSALETLAIVAYKQPVTKPEIDHIRGVDSAYVVKQLLEKGLVAVAGRHEGPGRALLYKTSDLFLRHFGLNKLDDLPKPREIDEILKDDDMVKHRQLLLELKAELASQESTPEQES